MKEIKKKLSLNKKSIAAIDTDAMQMVNGGATLFYTCIHTCNCPVSNQCSNTCDPCNSQALCETFYLPACDTHRP